MANISYDPNPVPTNIDDLSRYINDELERIRYYSELIGDVVDKLNTSFISATSLTKVAGGTAVGTVADVQALLDGNVYSIAEATGVPGFEVEFNFINVKSITGFVSMINYVGSASHIVTLGLYNYVTAQYDRFLQIPSTASVYAYRTVSIPDDTNYIDANNNAQMILYHETSGNASHDVNIDYVGLTGIIYE